jgi:hypothetical protein
LRVGAIVLVPALLLAGYALYQYHGAVEEHRKRVGWLLVIAALLVIFIELGKRRARRWFRRHRMGSNRRRYRRCRPARPGVWTLRTRTLLS